MNDISSLDKFTLVNIFINQHFQLIDEGQSESYFGQYFQTLLQSISR